MSHLEIPAFYDDLAATQEEAWRRLVRGAVDRRSGFHTPVLATIDADGAPRARTLVLRKVDPVARKMRFHTDWRSSKVMALTRDPRASVLVYDPQAKIQMRLEGRVLLHPPGSDVARACYAQTQPMSRVGYLQEPGPGVEMASPEDLETADLGDTNFAVMDVEACALEWLYLHAAGHRRARFTYEAGLLQRSVWIAP